MLVITVFLIVGSFIATVLGSSRPVLGLDLQGGTSIVLAPVKGSDLATLDTAVTIIRNRVDGLGIAEPNVSRQGNNIVIDLPGVKNAAEANQLVGKTAELRFRPVLGTIPYSSSAATSTTTTIKGATTTTIKGATTTTVKGATTTTAPATTTTAPAATSSTAPGATTTTVKGATTTTTVPKSDGTCQDGKLVTKSNIADKQVVLPDSKNTVCFLLGPTIMTGRNVGSADAIVNTNTGGWEVNVHFKNNDFVQKVAQPYVGKQVAIELDGVVQSAPTINAGHHGSGRHDQRQLLQQGGAQPRARAPVRVAAGTARTADRADGVADAREGPAARRHRRRPHRSRTRRALHDPLLPPARARRMARDRADRAHLLHARVVALDASRPHPHARGGDGHHRVGGCHRRQLCRVLRAIKR